MQITLNLRNVSETPPQDDDDVLAFCINPHNGHIFHVINVSGEQAKSWAADNETVLYTPMDEVQKETKEGERV